MLPSLLILIALSWIYLAFGEVPLVAGSFYGIKPASPRSSCTPRSVTGKRTLVSGAHAAIALAAFAAIFVFAVPFPLIVGGAALPGWPADVWRPPSFRRRRATR